MAAGYCDFIVDQGEDWTVQLVWSDFYDVPVPVTTPIRMAIKSPTGHVAHELYVPDTPPPAGELPAVSYNRDLGIIQVHMSKDVTSSLAPGVYGYDLFASVEDTEAISGNQVSRILHGSVHVRARVTPAL